MTKVKNPEKTKKASHSEPKAKAGVLSGMLKTLKEKGLSTLGAKEKVEAPATKDHVSGKSAAKHAGKQQTVKDQPLKEKPAKVAKEKSEPAKVAAIPEASAKELTKEVAAPKSDIKPQAAVDAVVTPEDEEEVVLTDAEGRRYCRATDCDQVGVVDGYCRYHYLFYWKKIQIRKKILADGKLERYIEELTARYTDKFVELLRKDLRTEKDFLAAIQELELDDSASSAQDEDEAKTYIEEISGVASESGREEEGF